MSKTLKEMKKKWEKPGMTQPQPEKINQLSADKFCLWESSSSGEYTKQPNFSSRSEGPKWLSQEMSKPFNANNKNEYTFIL